MAEIVLPQLGETVTEGTITRWFKQPGEFVEENEPLYEVSTDKVDTEVPADSAGQVAEILVAEGETVEVGTLLAKLHQKDAGGAGDAEGAARDAEVTPESGLSAPEVARAAPSTAPEPTAQPAQAAPEPVARAAAATPVISTPTAITPATLVPASPVVRRLLRKHGLDPTAIQGTGPKGRITRKDVEAAIAGVPQRGSVGSLQSEATAGAAAAASAAASSAAAGDTAVASTASESTIVPLSRIRLATAEHMLRSKATSPHVLTAVEVDFENVEKVRQAHRAEWKQEEGFSLTYLPFIARAVCDALDDYPHINASIEGENLLVHRSINLAVAVDLDFQGLLAPVLRGAEDLRLRAIARKVVDLSRRARAKKLSPDELTGGTFTLTNPGQWGTMMQFPIINQPQVAILSTDGIKRKPVVVTDADGGESIAIHSVGVLALAWDHRAFDGAYVAAFLDELRKIIQVRNWEEELA